MGLDRKRIPEVFPLPEPHLPGWDSYTLGNGVKMTVLRTDCEAEVFRITTVSGGGRAEARTAGLAGLYSTMLQEGSSKHSAAEIAETLESNGAWLQNSVSSHHFVSQLYGLNVSAAEVAGVLAEMISSPVFDEDILQIRRESAAQNAAVGLRKVSVRANNEIAGTVWGKGHHNAQINTPEAIRGVTGTELRDFHKRIFTPAGVSVYLAGHITDELERIVTDSFGSIAGNGKEPCIITPVPPTASCGDIVRRVCHDESKQAAIRVEIPTIGREHPDYEMLRIAVTALGGYFGSRLMTNLREERGLTYGISAGLSGSIDGATVSIETECRAEAADEAVEQIRREIENLATTALESEEMHRLRGYAMSRPSSTLDSPFTIIDVAKNIETLHTPEDYFERTNRAIAAATPEKIMEMAAKYVRLERAATVIAAP